MIFYRKNESRKENGVVEYSGKLLGPVTARNTTIDFEVQRESDADRVARELL